MIKEVLDEIAQAEKEAEEIIAQANDKARKITMGTEAELEKLKAEYSQEYKAFMLDVTQRAEIEGEKQAMEKVKQASVTAVAVVKQAEKNMQRTVEYITDKINKTR